MYWGLNLSKVIITVYGILREKLGWRSKEVVFKGDKITFRELLDVEPKLKSLMIQGANLIDDYIILLNGVHLQFKGGLNAVLRDGDEISIFPPGGGG